MFILVDCNNFYVSCEKLFNPKLKNKPVVVLSNNDGCIISRSNEAKKLNVLMGDPIFKYKHLIENNILEVFSSNFTLYSDISFRIMQTLESFGFEMEIYSVDEAFLEIKNYNFDIEKLLINIRKKIFKWVGIPVSIGCAKTKTLAKIASDLAKKENGYKILLNKESIDLTLKNISAIDIWGIGSACFKKLKYLQIFNGYDYKYADENIIKKNLGINGLKTFLELNEIVCFSLQNSFENRKSVCVSRSFSMKIKNIEDLKEKLALFASMAASKLRKYKLKTDSITIFINTSFHSKDPFYSASSLIKIPIQTSFTPDIIKYSFLALNKIYKDGFLYKKAGIILNNLIDEKVIQSDFFEKNITDTKNRLMKTMDLINFKANKKVLFFLSEGIEKNFHHSQNNKSKKFTTNFEDILKVD